MASYVITAAAVLLAVLALVQLSAAQTNPVPLLESDPNYVKAEIEMLKQVKGGDKKLRKKFVAYYFLDFGCASDPDKYMQSKMGHLYAWRSHSEAGVLDTVGDIMREAQNQLKYARPTQTACNEWKQKQEAANKAAADKRKQGTASDAGIVAGIFATAVALALNGR